MNKLNRKKELKIVAGFFAVGLFFVASGSTVTATSTMTESSSDHGHSSHDHEEDHSSHSMDVDTSLVQESTWGKFTVTLDHGTDTLPLNAFHTCFIEIRDKNGDPIDNAMIMVDGGMPAHGHGLPTQPQVTKNLGGGKFLVEGIKFSMPGMWQLKFHIDAEGEKDLVVFNFKV